MNTTTESGYQVRWDLESGKRPTLEELLFRGQLADAMCAAVPGCRIQPQHVTASGQLPAELLLLMPAATYMGKKVIDILADVARRWLTKRAECDHRTVPLYGSDGAVVKIVECDLKPHKQI